MNRAARSLGVTRIPRSPRFSNRRLLYFVWAAALVLLGGYVARASLGRTTHGFIAYYAASRLLTSNALGPQVYDDAWFMQYVKELTNTGVLEVFGPNPPSVALLAVPVTPFGPARARTLWLVSSVLAYGWACGWLICARHRHAGGVRPVLAVLIMLSPAVFANLRTGQVYLFLFLGLVVAANGLIRRQDGWAGLLVGLALLVKSSGLPLLILLFAARRTRAAIAAVLVCLGGGAAVVLWTGPDVWYRYPGYVLQFVQRPGASVTANQTMWGLLRHLCMVDPRWNPAPAASCAPVAMILPGLITAAAMLATVVVTARARTRTGPWVAAGVCLSVLVVPVAEEHQFVALGLPLLWLFTGGEDAGWRGSPPPWWAWLPVGFLLMVPLEWTALRFTTGWASLLAYPRLYAAWLLWAMALRAIHRDPLEPRPDEEAAA